MEMKKIVLGLICVSLLGSITSCSDFLEEKPKSEVDLSQNFTTPNHARTAVTKLYQNGAPDLYGDGGVYMPSGSTMGGYISGFFDNSEYKGQEVIASYSQTLTHTSKNIARSMDDVWDKCYEAIGRANTAIKYIPSTPELTDVERANLLGQAKFFRAFNFFYLVKFFGDVPLIVDPYESLENLYVARTPSAEVYAKIVEDLTFAVDNLNDVAFVDNGFRVTKSTAQTVLADVYLQMSGYPLQANKYVETATAARGVIRGGKHSLIPNGGTPQTSAYNVMRTEDNTKEYIYSFEYESSIKSNPKVQICLPTAATSLYALAYSLSNNAYAPGKAYLNVYDPEKDLRIQEKQFFHTSEMLPKQDGTLDELKFDTAPYIWYNEDAMLKTAKSSKDLALYRYAEVLLIAAEAIAQSEGVTSEAVGYLADVRARAYTTTDRADIVQSLSGLSKEKFIQEVWIERLRELVFDMRTWSDIQRTRMYPTTSEQAKGKVTFVNVVGATNAWGATYQEKDLLWPISDNEMQRNPSLLQNTGFDK